MALLRTGQFSFVDALVPGGLGRNERLDRLDGLVKWYRFEKVLARLRSGSGVGRPVFGPLVMFKALLLQSLYGLSDADLEAALAISRKDGICTTASKNGRNWHYSLQMREEPNRRTVVVKPQLPSDPRPISTCARRLARYPITASSVRHSAPTRCRVRRTRGMKPFFYCPAPLHLIAIAVRGLNGVTGIKARNSEAFFNTAA
jgi:hypothetical protein